VPATEMRTRTVAEPSAPVHRFRSSSNEFENFEWRTAWKARPRYLPFPSSSYLVRLILTIDYRCDNAQKNAELGRHLGINAQLMTPGFQKCRSLPLKNHLFTQKLQKNCSEWIVNSEPKLLWNRLFGGNLGKVGIVEFNFSSHWWVSVLLAHGDIGNCWICKSELLF
jgi:hypothetical protein